MQEMKEKAEKDAAVDAENFNIPGMEKGGEKPEKPE